MLKAYQRLLQQRPFATNMSTAFFIYGAGDVVAQDIQNRGAPTTQAQALNTTRTLDNAGWFVLFYCPFYTALYPWIDRVVSASTANPLHATLKKMVLMWSTTPLAASGYFLYGASLPHVKREVAAASPQAPPPASPPPPAMEVWSEKMSRDLLPTWQFATIFWMPINFLNFYLVPAPWRVLVMNTCSVAWGTFLSLKQYRRGDED
jgi:hypothetical protein